VTMPLALPISKRTLLIRVALHVTAFSQGFLEYPKVLKDEKRSHFLLK
jgi:hypothetical protein